MGFQAFARTYFHTHPSKAFETPLRQNRCLSMPAQRATGPVARIRSMVGQALSILHGRAAPARRYPENPSASLARIEGVADAWSRYSFEAQRANPHQSRSSA